MPPKKWTPSKQTPPPGYEQMDERIKRRNRNRKRGCFGCLGCSGILLILLIVLAACAPKTAPTTSPSTDAPSSVSSSSAPSTSDSPTATASSESASPSASATASSAPAGKPGTALAMLGTLEVKGKAPKTGYDREDDFGQAWADVDHNGCDTRNDILRRDLTAIAIKAGTRGCKVASGTLADPYTGSSIDFTAGAGTSSAVQIDHVVALSDAWQTGAQQISADRREALANDPLNLVAVDGPANEAKHDGDAAEWLPANKSYRCTYVAHQIAVKHNYKLWVTRAEHDAMAHVLNDCQDEGVPTAGTAPLMKDKEEATPAPAKTHAPAAENPQPAAPAETAAPAAPGSGQQTSVTYGSCAEARAAGAAPLYAGSDGYSRKLDRDGDGVACESKK